VAQNPDVAVPVLHDCAHGDDLLDPFVMSSSHVARASRLVGIVDDDRDVHPVGDVELDEEAGYV
jgi:hypothetical protein